MMLRSAMVRPAGACCRVSVPGSSVPRVRALSSVAAGSSPNSSVLLQHQYQHQHQHLRWLRPPPPPQQQLAALLSTAASPAPTTMDLGEYAPLAEHHLPKRLHTQFDGVVVSTSMQKSILVAVTRTRLNRKYNKRQRYTRKFMAHDEDETCELGDKVRIQMSRPISKHKKFNYVMTLKKAEKL